MSSLCIVTGRCDTLAAMPHTTGPVFNAAIAMK
jgi:hypothetical protein